jgi:ubiquinone/menaquinone biosynthesis C-methylase UbiE
LAGYFRISRKESIDSLDIQPGQKVLIVGAGTGLDLEFLPEHCEITAIDLTPTMVQRMEQRNKELKRQLQALVMDGHRLEFADESFDKVVLHLILAVIPDPIACILEAERVLKPGGEAVVFDKFVHKGGKVSLLRKTVNLLTNFFATDITRDFETMVEATHFTILSDQNADFKGNFRRIKLKK